MTEAQNIESEFRSGIVSIVGRPNVGKSTLVNALVDSDLSITSVHPHTTRTQVRAIDNGDNYQIIYVDTPGIHKPRNPLGEKMNDAAYDALAGVDLIVAVFDVTASIGNGDRFVAEHLQNRDNVFIALNKCDAKNSMDHVAQYAQQILELVPNVRHIFNVSAFTKKNVHLLKKAIIEMIPVGPALYDRTSTIDMSDEQLVAEMYREQLMRKLRDELPQGLHVIAKESPSDGAKREFDLKIIVASNSHKPIVIGRAGSMLEDAGTRARQKCEVLLGEPIVIRARVVVDENWQSRSDHLDQYFF
jgi:GTP-binding protein Era